MGKRRRGQRKARLARGVAIGREELRRMHAAVKAVCQEQQSRPGTEAYNLLCQIGASMGSWPRARKTTVAEMRARTSSLLRGEPEDKRGLDCQRCGTEVSADLVECLFGDYWLCPTCARQHKFMSAAAKETQRDA